MRFVSALLLGSMVALGACAKGSDFLLGGGGSGVGGAGSIGSGSGVTSESQGSTGASSGGAGGSGGSGASSGSGGSETSSSTGGSGGTTTGPTCDFTAPNACSTAEPMADVAGDEGGISQASGVGSKWLKIHVVEASASIFPSDLSYTVTLGSPPGMVYDLFVREGPQDGNPSCTAPEMQGTGSPSSVSDWWSDDQGFGGEDDSVWLVIEVRYVSGDDCTTPWQLTVIGAT